MKTTSIVCIGDELLDGRVVEANAHYLTRSARALQLDIRECRTVGDDTDAIVATLADLDKVDIVVVSGGLGPTADDVTRQAAAEFANASLVEVAAAIERIKRRFASRDIEFTDNNRRQCQFPDSADVLPSQVGTADGFRLSVDGIDYFFFPGVPHEFQWFADRHLQQQRQNTAFRRRFSFFGRGESDLEDRLGDLPKRAQQQGLKFGIRAEFPVIEIVIEGDDADGPIYETEIRDRIGRWLVAEGDQSLSQRLGEQLMAHDASVTVAESCTAGLLAAMLTEVSGSSRYFEVGYLTYANSAKVELVDVDQALLDEYGAVSPQVVTQMAAGARRRSGADYALAISGIAGPTGGTEDKPVGTVDFGLATPEGVFCRRVHLQGRSRRQGRVLSVHIAASMLLWRLEDRLSAHPVDGPFDYSDVDAGITVGD